MPLSHSPLNDINMLKRIIPLIALLLFAAPARAEQRTREGFEVAVDKALQYLAGAQLEDGSWTSGGGFGMGRGGGSRDPAITALCVMSFLSAGHVPGEGPYGDRIIKGVRYVCSQQQNGVFAGNMFGNTVMYSHGICTLMVAEIIGLLPDRKEAAQLRQQLVAAVKLIKSAQCKRNGEQGWRYSTQPVDSDMSVTAWQIMALRAAKNVGCDVPSTVIENAVEYVNNSRDPNTGGYRYTRYGQVTVPCTGASILSLELCGKEYHGSKTSTDAAQYITDEISGRKNAGFQVPGPNFRGNNHFFYGIYYTSQAMFQVGSVYWKWYREYLHSLLLRTEPYAQRSSGFWPGISNDDNMAGVNYCTAMAVLALTVEYRFLPIYQRGEEPEEREGK